MIYQYVYFVVAEEVSRVKIGHTRDIGARMDALETGSPCSLSLLGFIATNGDMAPRIETALQKHLKAWRWNREWFSLTPTLREFLSRFILHFDMKIKDPQYAWQRAQNEQEFEQRVFDEHVVRSAVAQFVIHASIQTTSEGSARRK
jgi:hypothetical protein